MSGDQPISRNLNLQLEIAKGTSDWTLPECQVKDQRLCPFRMGWSFSSVAPPGKWFIHRDRNYPFLCKNSFLNIFFVTFLNYYMNFNFLAFSVWEQQYSSSLWIWSKLACKSQKSFQVLFLLIFSTKMLFANFDGFVPLNRWTETNLDVGIDGCCQKWRFSDTV